jgi:hypothetical protein
VLLRRMEVADGRDAQLAHGVSHTRFVVRATPARGTTGA